MAFVLVDRITRVVVGHRLFGLQGPARAALVDRWSADPHFERAPLFIEDRSQGDRSAPAYYLSSSWLVETLGLHGPMSGVYPFDGGTWTRLRQEGRGRDPLLSVLDARAQQSAHRCSRCGGTLRRILRERQLETVELLRRTKVCPNSFAPLVRAPIVRAWIHALIQFDGCCLPTASPQ